MLLNLMRVKHRYIIQSLVSYQTECFHEVILVPHTNVLSSYGTQSSKPEMQGQNSEYNNIKTIIHTEAYNKKTMATYRKMTWPYDQ